MAFVDDPNQNESENVAGSAPLSQGTAAPASQEGSTSPTGDSSPSSIQSSGSTQKPRTTSKSGKASSGMFTNIPGGIV